MKISTLVWFIFTSSCCNALIQPCRDIGPAMINAEDGFYVYAGPSTSYYANMKDYRNDGDKNESVEIVKRHFSTSMNNTTFYSRFKDETGSKMPTLHWKWTGKNKTLSGEILDSYYCTGGSQNEFTIVEIFGCYDRQKAWERKTPDHVRQVYLDKYRMPLKNPYAKDECSCSSFNFQSRTKINTLVGKCDPERPAWPALPSKYLFAAQDRPTPDENKPSKDETNTGGKSQVRYMLVAFISIIDVWFF